MYEVERSSTGTPNSSVRILTAPWIISVVETLASSVVSRRLDAVRENEAVSGSTVTVAVPETEIEGRSPAAKQGSAAINRIAVTVAIFFMPAV